MTEPAAADSPTIPAPPGPAGRFLRPAWLALFVFEFNAGIRRASWLIPATILTLLPLAGALLASSAETRADLTRAATGVALAFGVPLMAAAFGSGTLRGHLPVAAASSRLSRAGLLTARILAATVLAALPGVGAALCDAAVLNVLGEGDAYVLSRPDPESVQTSSGPRDYSRTLWLGPESLVFFWIPFGKNRSDDPVPLSIAYQSGYIDPKANAATGESIPSVPLPDPAAPDFGPLTVEYCGFESDWHSLSPLAVTSSAQSIGRLDFTIPGGGDSKHYFNHERLTLRLTGNRHGLVPGIRLADITLRRETKPAVFSSLALALAAALGALAICALGAAIGAWASRGTALVACFCFAAAGWLGRDIGISPDAELAARYSSAGTVGNAATLAPVASRSALASIDWFPALSLAEPRERRERNEHVTLDEAVAPVRWSWLMALAFAAIAWLFLTRREWASPDS
jgi:hypothetical protein